MRERERVRERVRGKEKEDAVRAAAVERGQEEEREGSQQGF